MSAFAPAFPTPHDGFSAFEAHDSHVLRDRSRIHDHLPRHVHVWKNEMEAVISIDTLEIREFNHQAIKKFIRSAWNIVAANQEFLRSEWDTIKPIP